MSCDVQIVPGRNAWLFSRTDRDAVQVQDVIQTAAAALVRFLGSASPLGTRSVFEVIQNPSPEGVGRYFIGAARPVRITAHRAAHATDRSGVPAGAVARKRIEQCGEAMTIRAGTPWIVVADFDWRGEAVTVPWPRRQVNAFGLASDTEQFDNDWLLLEAHKYAAPLEPDQEPRPFGAITDTLQDMFQAAGTLGGLLIVWALYNALQNGKR